MTASLLFCSGSSPQVPNLEAAHAEALAGPRPDPGAPVDPADDRALRERVEACYAAYGRRDLAAYWALWSHETPERRPRGAFMDWLFWRYRRITVLDLQVRKIAVEQDRARVEVTLAIEWAPADQPDARPVPQRLERVFRFVRERGKPAAGWRIVRFGDPDYDLAADLAAAPAGQRRRLLDTFAPRATPALVRALARRALFDSTSFEAATSLCALARELAARTGRPAVAGFADLYTGYVHLRDSNPGGACRAFEASLEQCQVAGDARGQERALSGLIDAQGELEDWLAAAESAKALGEIYRSAGNPAGQANACQRAGDAQLRAGDAEASLGSYEAARRTFAEVGDPRGQATSLCGIARAQDRLDRAPEAVASLRSARQLFDRARDWRGASAALGQLAFVDWRTGNLREALVAFNQSLPIQKRLKDPQGVAATLTNISALEAMQGNYGSALKSLPKAAASQLESWAKRLGAR